MTTKPTKKRKPSQPVNPWRQLKIRPNGGLPILLAAVAALEEATGTATEELPCGGADGPLWISEDPAEREEAAERCGGCPLVAECHLAGRAEVWGVWGAEDRSGRRPLPLTPRSHAKGRRATSTPSTEKLKEAPSEEHLEGPSPDLKSSGLRASCLVSREPLAAGHKRGHNGPGNRLKPAPTGPRRSASKGMALEPAAT